ncbi:MAG: SapC family protein [Desulfohalobiaceae bacterium]|nr:SapC family protein [Desulfohalobiaceae bacterium]
MTNLAAITRDRFGGKFWRRYNSYAFAASSHLTPLVATELPRALQALPLAFIKQGEQFVLAGVLSLTPGQNLYVDQKGQWLGPYVPSSFRSYPFRLARAEGRDDLILCVDEDSGLISDTDGEPFFQENGNLSESLTGVLDFLKKVEQNRSATQRAVSSLAEAGLMTEWPLKIKVEGAERPVSGLFMINESKLNSLDDQAFLKLRSSQSLPIAYAQLFSMGNIARLEKLAEAREPKKDQGYDEMDIEKLFGNDDLIRFDGE